MADANNISHRLPSRKNSNPDNYPAIIVKFTRRDTRSELYNAKKFLKHKTIKDLGLGRHSERKIFISESLTKKNRELFNKCLKAKKDLNFRFIWTKYGKISLRKDADNRAVTINNDMDLQRLYFDENSGTYNYADDG